MAESKSIMSFIFTLTQWAIRAFDIEGAARSTAFKIFRYYGAAFRIFLHMPCRWLLRYYDFDFDAAEMMEPPARDARSCPLRAYTLIGRAYSKTRFSSTITNMPRLCPPPPRSRRRRMPAFDASPAGFTPRFTDGLTPQYTGRFARCGSLFEMTTYSSGRI